LATKYPNPQLESIDEKSIPQLLEQGNYGSDTYHLFITMFTQSLQIMGTPNGVWIRGGYMSSRKMFVLVFGVIYTAITGGYSGIKWIDSSGIYEILHVILFACVILTASVAVHLIKKDRLLQCFLVSGTALSLIYAGIAVLSEDYNGLILPAVVAVVFLVLPQARQWIEAGSTTRG
jgi:hypothetical protein